MDDNSRLPTNVHWEKKKDFKKIEKAWDKLIEQFK
jgi:hypothetical protein